MSSVSLNDETDVMIRDLESVVSIGIKVFTVIAALSNFASKESQSSKTLVLGETAALTLFLMARVHQLSFGWT